MSKTKTILIATPLYPPDVGGPSYYAKSLENEFESLGFQTLVCTYGWERKLPVGLRHLYYFFRVLFAISKANYIICLDAFSVGLPVVAAAKIFKKKVIIRTGGDFLWETYVNRTKQLITLSSFYNQPRDFNLKEKIIFKLTHWTLTNAWKIVFSTDWQRQVWLQPYNLSEEKTSMIENYFGSEREICSVNPTPLKKYLWAGRDIFLKNIDLLKKAFKRAQEKESNLELEIVTGLSQTDLFEKIKSCDVVIVPSLSDISPNLVLEGITLGKPFILTRETGYKEKLKHCGLFIDPLDINEIAQAVLEMSKPEVYRSYCGAVNKFNFAHTYKDISQEFIKLFE